MNESIALLTNMLLALSHLRYPKIIVVGNSGFLINARLLTVDNNKLYNNNYAWNRRLGSH